MLANCTTQDCAVAQFMNMPYHMDYAHTHVPMQTTKHHRTMHISDVSEFEIIMITSSNEDIPPLKDIRY